MVALRIIKRGNMMTPKHKKININGRAKTMFAQYMNQQDKSKNKHEEELNRIREHHRAPKEKKMCVVVITMLICVNHPLGIIICQKKKLLF